MATKKQKHAAAVEKRELFLAMEYQRGLMAQAQDRQNRAALEAQAKEEGRRLNQRPGTKFLNALFKENKDGQQ